jgi:hypothetical protein
MKRRPLSLPFVLTAVLSPGVLLADTSTKPKLPKSEHPERVRKNPDGTCTEMPEMGSCPPGAHCNPGPPRDVQCPPETPKKK